VQRGLLAGDAVRGCRPSASESGGRHTDKLRNPLRRRVKQLRSRAYAGAILGDGLALRRMAARSFERAGVGDLFRIAAVGEKGHAETAYSEPAEAKGQMAALEFLAPMSKEYVDKLEA
jgi:hypothetical protein